MKQINFVTPISKQTKSEVYRWIVISGLLTFAVILFIGISVFGQCYHYSLLRAEKKQVMADHSQCTLVLQTQKEKDVINNSRSERLTQLQRYQHQPESITRNLRACNQAIGTGALQSCTLSKKTIELAYKSSTISHAQTIIQKLQTVPSISNLQLVALQRQNNGVMSTVHAEVTG